MRSLDSPIPAINMTSQLGALMIRTPSASLCPAPPLGTSAGAGEAVCRQLDSKSPLSGEMSPLKAGPEGFHGVNAGL